MQLLKGSKSSPLDLGSIGESGISLLPVDPDDMWHANNLISDLDILKAHAVRKVTSESTTGSTKSERVHTELTIRVKSTFFDAASSQLHVSGTVTSENAWVHVGQYHTLDLELHRPFTLWKQYGWDSVTTQLLLEALNSGEEEAIAAIVMHDGLANICVITDYRTILKQRIESNVPKKRSATSEIDGGMRRFFDKTLTSLLRVVDFKNTRPLLIASPGFIAQDFQKYIADEGARKNDKMLMRIAREASTLHSSSGHLHSLNEILKSPQVQASMKGKKFANETKLMDDFMHCLRKDDGRAWYGIQPVEKAVQEGAVGRGGGILLVNNSLFRSVDIATRKQYVALVDKVKEDGGEAKVLSSDHESGQRLDTLSGIAAVLTYPLYNLDETGNDADAPADEGTSII